MGNCICKQEFHGPLLSGAVSVDAHVLPIWFSPVLPTKKLFPGPVSLSRGPGCCERAARCWPRHTRSAAGREGCSWLAGLAAGGLGPASRRPRSTGPISVFSHDSGGFPASGKHLAGRAGSPTVAINRDVAEVRSFMNGECWWHMGSGAEPEILRREKGEGAGWCCSR